MAFKEYKTEWVTELPAQCPECGETTQDNSFTSKKGERWESVKCEACALKWMKSKPKGKTSQNSTQSLTGAPEVMEALRKIYAKLEEIAKMIKLGE